MVYNIYKKDGPEAEAGRKLRETFNNTVGKAVQEKATNIGNAALGAVNTLTTPQRVVYNNTLKPLVVQPLVDANKRQNEVLDRNAAIKGNRDERNANAKLFGDQSRIVGGSNFMSQNTNMTPEREKLVVDSARSGVATPVSPVNQSLLNRAQSFKPPGINPVGPMAQRSAPFNPDQGVNLDNSTAARAMRINANGPPMTTEYSQGPNGTFSKRDIPLRQPVQDMNQQPGIKPNGIQRAGNLDVQFNASVPQDARKAFLENPIRPTAQIDRYDARQRLLAAREQAAAQAASQAPKDVTEMFGGKAPGWKTRGRLMEQALANQQSEKNARIQAQTQIQTGQMGNDVTRERNDIDRMKVGVDAEAAKARTDVDRMNVTGQNQERGANVKAKEMEIANVQKVQDLENRYLAEKDPDKKRALEREYSTLRGKAQPKYQIVPQEGVDPVTMMPIKKSFAVNPENPSESFEIGGKGGDQYNFLDTSPENKAKFAALKKSNPKEYEKLRQQFLAQNQ